MAQFGGRATPAAGFAIGLERLILLIKGLEAHAAPQTDIYVVTADAQSQLHAMHLVEALRRALPNQVIQVHMGGGSFKSQFKRADRSGAQFALVYCESEQATESVTLKPLRSQGEQVTLPDNQLAAFLAESLPGKNGD